MSRDSRVEKVKEMKVLLKLRQMFQKSKHPDDINKKKLLGILFVFYVLIFMRYGMFNSSIFERVFMSALFVILIPLMAFLVLWPIGFMLLLVWTLLVDFYKWFDLWIHK